MKSDRKKLWRKWIGGLTLLLAVVLVLPTNWRPLTTNRLSLMVMKGVLLHLPPVAGSETIKTDFQGLSVEKRARLLGSLLLSQGEYEAARTALSQGVNVSQPDPLVLVFLAEANDRLGEEQAALDTWKQAGALPQLINRGKQAEQSGNSQMASQFYQAALELNPGNSLAIDAAVRLYEKQKKLLEATQVLENAIHSTHSQDSLEWYLWLGKILQKDNRWEEAADNYRETLRRFSDNYQAHVELGRSLYFGGHPLEEALVELDQAIAQAPEEPKAYMVKGEIYRAEQRYDEAFKFYVKASELDPESYWPLAQQAAVLMDKRDIQAAIHMLEEASIRFPDQPHCFYLLSYAYHSNGQTERAIEAARKAVELDTSNNISYSLQLAKLYEAGGYIEQAIAVYEAILAINPAQQEALEAIQRLRPNP